MTWEEIKTLRIQTFRDKKEKFTCFFSVLKTKNYLCHKEEFSSPIPKCSCWLKLKYCSTTQTYFPFLQNTAAQNPTIQLNMISHQNWKRNWGKNQEEKLSFFSQNFDSWEENLFAKSHSIEKRKNSSKSWISRGEWEFFLQNQPVCQEGHHHTVITNFISKSMFDNCDESENAFFIHSRNPG